jgi:hypothetical protein
VKVFDVRLNGRPLYRAGVGRDGVLNAIVSWTKLTGPAARRARRQKSPVEETRLDVGGLRGGVHREWLARPLKVGDEVTIAVRPAGRVDAPALTKRSLPSRVQRQGAETTFLNVDLDIWSATSLDPLVAAFGRRVLVLHSGKEGRRYVAHLELARSGYGRDADALIREFAALVRRLPRRRRALWNAARTRDFNIGLQAGFTPHAFELPVQPATLQAAASVDARVVVTVYAAGWTDPRTSRRRS